jgi:hypothetical protein
MPHTWTSEDRYTSRQGGKLPALVRLMQTVLSRLSARSSYCFSLPQIPTIFSDRMNEGLYPQWAEQL